MKKLLLTLFLSVSSLAFADCPSLYPNNNPIHEDGAMELCNSFYVSLYDAKHKAVLLTSELLTSGIGKVERVNSFHADERIPEESRVTPSDYAKTGEDKGHMAPAADAMTTIDMYQSFLMTNMTPQEPTLNRIEWKKLEMNVRSSITKNTWVVTIAVYNKNFQPQIKAGVPIPVGYWKLVYTDHPHAYYAPNVPHGKVEEKAVVPATLISTLLPH